MEPQPETPPGPPPPGPPPPPLGPPPPILSQPPLPPGPPPEGLPPLPPPMPPPAGTPQPLGETGSNAMSSKFQLSPANAAPLQKLGWGMEKIAEVHGIFSMFDPGNTGYITSNSLSTFYQSLGAKYEDADLLAALTDFAGDDFHGDLEQGGLDFSTFAMAFEKQRSDFAAGCSDAHTVVARGSAQPKPDRITSVLELCGEHVTPEEAEEMSKAVPTKQRFMKCLGGKSGRRRSSSTGLPFSSPSVAGKTKAPEIAQQSQSAAAGEGTPYAPFFKMLKMGVPRGAVENKVKAAGLDPAMLDNPNALQARVGASSGAGKALGGSGPASADPRYAPFFKMLKMGVPRGAVENKIRAAGLDVSVLGPA